LGRSVIPEPAAAPSNPAEAPAERAEQVLASAGVESGSEQASAAPEPEPMLTGALLVGITEMLVPLVALGIAKAMKVQTAGMDFGLRDDERKMLAASAQPAADELNRLLSVNVPYPGLLVFGGSVASLVYSRFSVVRHVARDQLVSRGSGERQNDARASTRSGEEPGKSPAASAAEYGKNAAERFRLDLPARR